VADPWSDGLLESGFGDAGTASLVGWRARVRRMVEVEAALARALGRVGLFDDATVAAVVAACAPDRLDLDALASAAASAATPVIPLVRALTAGAAGAAAERLHHGATSQDVIDTATVLQVRDAVTRLDTEVAAVAARCAQLADEHRATVMAGRTLGQQAVPVTFGLTAARWLGALDRRREQLDWVTPRVLTVQLGGAAGTLAVYGDRGREVVEALADELDLGVPDLAWHAERDRIVELAGALAGVVATVATIAGDLVRLAQTEVGEVREGAGDAPGSSAMPHKRNPVHATAARAAARLALGDLDVLVRAAGDHELERAAGAWQAEWVALPSALVRTAGAVVRLRAALEHLEVDADRARHNLDGAPGSTRARGAGGLTGSEALATALTDALGRPEAQALVATLAARAAANGQHLREVAVADPAVTAVLAPGHLAEVLDPAAVVPQVDAAIDRALATHHALVTTRDPARDQQGSP
jgi:3-carboxy-cis,cis-muconate cycloisomerase